MGAGKDVRSKGISGTCGDINTRGCNPQAGRVALTNPRNNTWDPCPEECKLRNSQDTALDPSGFQASGRGPELEGDTRPPTEGEWGIFFVFTLYNKLFITLGMFDIFWLCENRFCPMGYFIHILLLGMACPKLLSKDSSQWNSPCWWSQTQIGSCTCSQGLLGSRTFWACALVLSTSHKFSMGFSFSWVP